ncbi:F0F1 ATP synthase subunit delta [Nesterenkonia halobia]|uniref:ATP synthase subunit delta n=1 Tax=Nesterenkonia halobia TaxID=37922 RepID=A0ABP6RF56_9MICC
MAAVTSESLAAVLREQARTLESADLAVADELFGAVDVLDSSSALRRSLTDPAREPDERTSVVRGLFGEKVAPTTLTLLEALVSKRFSRDRDLADSVETLAVTVVAQQAEADGLDGLERLETQLLAFRRTVGSSHEVQRALTEPQAGAEALSTLASRLSPDAGAEARLLIDRAVVAPRGLRPEALVERFAEQVAARQSRWIARVTVAQELDADRRERLRAGLDRYFGRELKLDVVVDPEVVGGIRVQVGDEVVDSTISAKVDDLQRRLAG